MDQPCPQNLHNMQFVFPIVTEYNQPINNTFFSLELFTKNISEIRK